MEYRLLKRNEIIQATDELLRDDCQTWEPFTVMSQWAIGTRFDPATNVPVRRPL